jgi:ATP-dependent helicase YprA (DUF1998 family)
MKRSLLTAKESHIEYLVFDELYTYRGRQGADVALLVRGNIKPTLDLNQFF